MYLLIGTAYCQNFGSTRPLKKLLWKIVHTCSYRTYVRRMYQNLAVQEKGGKRSELILRNLGLARTMVLLQVRA